MEFYFRKFPKQQPVIEEKDTDAPGKRAVSGVFVSKLLPMSADDHLDPGGNGAHGLSQIYGQFCMPEFLSGILCLSEPDISSARRQSDSGIAGGMRMKIAMPTNNYKPFLGGVPISAEEQAKALVNWETGYAVFARNMTENFRRRGSFGKRDRIFSLSGHRRDVWRTGWSITETDPKRDLKSV